MRRLWAPAGLAVLVCAAAAYGVNKGDTLYIRARSTGLMESPRPNATAIAILQPGMSVTYIAPAAGAGGWHEVTTDLKGQPKQGFVYQSNLTKQQPSTEVVTTHGPPVNASAFIDSGAASKALSEGAIRYGTVSHPDYERAVKDIQSLEVMAKAIREPQIFAHEREAHLHPNVGQTAPAPGAP
jgi:hypothetical protein